MYLYSLPSILSVLALILGPPLLVALWQWSIDRAAQASYDEGMAVGFSLGRKATNNDNQ